MKSVNISLCFAIMLLISISSIAQKPSSPKLFLFKNYPAIINCTEAQLNNLFAAARGESISLSLSNELKLQGSITSKITKYNNLQTLTIKLPGFKNILFSVTKRTDDNNKNIFVGHLFNTDYADGYQLKRNADNSYQFIKIETEKLLPTCNQ